MKKPDECPKTNALIRAKFRSGAARYNAMRRNARELEIELATVTKQRDGLAKALIPILKWMGVDTSQETPPEAYASEMAQNGLRALQTP